MILEISMPRNKRTVDLVGTEIATVKFMDFIKLDLFKRFFKVMDHDE